MKQPVIFCIIAIHNNADLLIRRSFRSAVTQTLVPEHIVLVCNPTLNLDKNILDNMRNELPHLSKLHTHINDRTECLAGYWNAGSSYALSVTDDPENTYVALLNEEDEWLPDHLSVCLEDGTEFDVFISKATIEENQQASQVYSIEHLLSKVPSIRSSRLCFRLSSILKAGLFDENLSDGLVSDLLIRFVEVGARIHPTRKQTVSLNTDEKSEDNVFFPTEKGFQGMRSFKNKYWPRLSESLKSESISEIGGRIDRPPLCEGQTRIPEPPINVTRFHLIVGIVSSDPIHLSRFLKGLSILVGNEALSKITLLVIANRGCDEVILSTVSEHLPTSIQARFVASSDYLPLGPSGAFGPWPNNNEGVLDIVLTRSILQKYLGELMKTHPGSIGWILDDDMVITTRTTALISWLPEFREAGVDVLLGTFEGDSPNPCPNGLRVQLVDLLHNLERVHHSAIRNWPELEEENCVLRMAFPDYYYDLSRKHHGHLETPFWVNISETNTPRESPITQSPAILSGVCLTRPLQNALPQHPIEESFASCNRGGNTVIFNWKALAETPNLAIRFGNNNSRRSDMIWALINKYRNGMKIQRVNFPIYHTREHTTQSELDRLKVVGEVFGSALYAGFSEFLNDTKHHSFSFSAEELEKIASLTLHYINQRLLKLHENWFRIQGLINALAKYNMNEELKTLLRPLRDWVDNDNWAALKMQCLSLNKSNIIEFLRSMNRSITTYSTTNLPLGWAGAN